jgi:hypothetical protein
MKNHLVTIKIEDRKTVWEKPSGDDHSSDRKLIYKNPFDDC